MRAPRRRPAVRAMFAAGLDGVGLQEQQFIGRASVADRAAAVRATATRYRTLATAMGNARAPINVQIMPSRCRNGDAHAASSCGGNAAVPFSHCAASARATAGDVVSVGIWASNPTDRADLVPLIQALRGECSLTPWLHC